jgi:2-keto-3-deoxy-L-arabinonate dehydratase
MTHSLAPADGLRGCIPIVCTPFAEDGSLDIPSLEREIDWLIAEGASGVATLAIASEGYKLTEDERDEVLSTVVRATRERVPIIASADGAGTEVALDRARRVAKLGADAVMVLPPYFVKPDAQALADYYLRVAAAGGIPVIIQDAPQLTGVAMSPALWAQLADDAALIQYVKVEGNPQGPPISAAITASAGKLAVFCGWGGLSILDALERGAVGSMPAPNVTRLFTDIQSRFLAGDIAVAERLFAAELPFLLWSMQTVDHSVLAAKEELRRRGIIATNHRRQPALELDEIALGQLGRFLDARLG